MSRLENCTNLHRLTLRGVVPYSNGIDVITSLSNLQKITDLSFLQVQLHLMERTYQYRAELNTSLMSLFKLSNLRAFRFSTDYPLNTHTWFNIDTFLRAIRNGNWPNLKILSLAGITPPSGDTFARMALAMPKLETLELHGNIITDENIGLIAQHLKNLTSVVFINGNYTPEGIKGISGHPSLETLSLFELYQYVPCPQWLFAVYDVLHSLPKIIDVKLVGYGILTLQAMEQGIPQVPKHVKLDMKNSIEVLEDLSIIGIHSDYTTD